VFGSGWFVSIAYLILVCVSLVAQDLRYAFVPAAGTIVLFFLSGFAVFRRVGGAFAIPWPASLDGTSPSEVVIQGAPLPFRGYDQDLIITFQVRRLPELLGVASLATLTLTAILLGRVSAEPLIHGFSLFRLEILCIAGWQFLILNLRWLSERRFLPGSHVTLGQIVSRDPGFVRAGITYQFFDDENERRGGHGPFKRETTDNAVLVFYDPKDPDRNMTQGAFRFHRFDLGLIPNQGTTANQDK